MNEGYDPLKLGSKVREYVVKERGGIEYRRYYRFRGGLWYGGSATGDVIGCNLRCKFCWSSTFRDNYRVGKFYSPEEAFNKLRRIAERRGYRLIRLSGSEPTLSMKHVIDLIKLCEEFNYVFILETNGILLGARRDYVRELSRFNNLVVRVSIKGACEKDFNILTGAKELYFELQLQALRNLIDAGLTPGREVVVAIMASFSSDNDLARLIMRLSEIHDDLINSIDWEVVILYPNVRKLLRKYGLVPKRFIEP